MLSCHEEYNIALEQAIFVWSIIAGWVLFSSTLYCIVLQERIEGAPALGAQFFGVSGIIQVSVVVISTAFFFPVCLSCYCPPYHPWLYLVPAIEGLVGVACLWSALGLYHRASQVSNDIFTKIPTEAELTEVTECTDDDNDEEETRENDALSL